jgi:hypothetical protein
VDGDTDPNRVERRADHPRRVIKWHLVGKMTV